MPIPKNEEPSSVSLYSLAATILVFDYGVYNALNHGPEVLEVLLREMKKLSSTQHFKTGSMLLGTLGAGLMAYSLFKKIHPTNNDEKLTESAVLNREFKSP